MAPAQHVAVSAAGVPLASATPGTPAGAALSLDAASAGAGAVPFSAGGVDSSALIVAVFVGNVLSLIMATFLKGLLEVAAPFLRPTAWACAMALAMRPLGDRVFEKLKCTLRRENGTWHLMTLPMSAAWRAMIGDVGGTHARASDAYFTWLKRAWVGYVLFRLAGAMPVAVATALAMIAGAQGITGARAFERVVSGVSAATAPRKQKDGAPKGGSAPLQQQRSPSKPATAANGGPTRHGSHSSSSDNIMTPAKQAAAPNNETTSAAAPRPTWGLPPFRLLARAWNAIDRSVCASLSEPSLLHMIAAVVLLVGGVVLFSAVASVYTTMVVRELASALDVARGALAHQLRVGRDAAAYATSEVLRRGADAGEIDRDAATSEGPVPEPGLADALSALGSREDVREFIEYAQSYVNDMAARHNFSAPLLLDFVDSVGGSGAGNAMPWVELPSEVTALVEQGQTAWARLMLGDLSGTAQALSAAAVGATTLASESMASVGDALGQHPMDVLASVRNHGLRAAGSAFGVTTGMLAGGTKALVAIGSGVAGVLLNGLTFAFTLFYLLSSEKPPIELLTDVLPIEDHERAAVGTALQESVRAVFVVVLKEAAFHGSFMLLLLMLLRAPLQFSASAAAAVLAAIPVVPPSVAAIPAVLMMENSRRMWGLLGVLAHWGVAMFADAAIQSESGTHYYAFALSVFGGIAAFTPAWEGAVLGPLLLTGVSFMLKLGRLLAPQSPSTGVAATPAGRLRERLRRVFTPTSLNVPRNAPGSVGARPAWQM